MIKYEVEGTVLVVLTLKFPDPDLVSFLRTCRPKGPALPASFGLAVSECDLIGARRDSHSSRHWTVHPPR